MYRFFRDFGCPEVLESDNGTQFANAEFRDFCRKIGVTQVTSSPEFAQSNGLVERHIQTVKNTLLKMFADGKSLWQSLAAIRSTPVSGSLPAPSVLLQGRNLRGNLPFLPAELAPKIVPASLVQSGLASRQATAAFNNPRQLTSRSSILSLGQQVRARIGVVQRVCKEPHSSLIRLRDDRSFRRTWWAINDDKSHVAPADSSGGAYVEPRSITSVQPHASLPSSVGTVAQRLLIQENRPRIGELPRSSGSTSRHVTFGALPSSTPLESAGPRGSQESGPAASDTPSLPLLRVGPSFAPPVRRLFAADPRIPPVVLSPSSSSAS